ncbi:hypothetical protein CEP48_07710 [Mergibacter septicus]|uniref:Uncharacterized protein n=1 Tax=Mergibacter septicus TaxID=221402 RepID=A0A8E3MHL7_9PAST|nr:hypothetical protein [Mergibacter septicus]AWX16060.1 hypothetical protein CEP47_07710 [Mergibacter septicus]QDJ15313.1 hypothetical protein CEP48_07710 [Mergibacter septicus]UTU48819.1 hypothetical protein HLL31_08730 [Mergibacter septicus]WMR95551.1 hypothetical protein RDJ12_06290 [Mergibacter septicus]
MRKNLLALLISLALINKNTYATLARHDIDWSEYEDFALNIGRYEAGRKGIIVYKKDGTISGTIDVPMPTFYGVSDSGNGTLYADPQIIATVAHVGNGVGNHQVQRFMRGDVELSKDFKKKSKWNKLLEYSEAYSPNEHKTPMQNLDHKLVRLNQVMFDFTPFEAIPEGEKNTLGKVGDLLARVGNGSPKIATAVNQEVWSRWGLSGGLNKVKWEHKNKPGLAIEFNPKTPIDTGTKAGDSGSPVFIWSEKSQKWYLFATNAAGSGFGYGKNSHLTKDLDGLHRILKEYNKEIDKTGDTDLSTDKSNEKKNLVYTKGVNVKINSDVNLGPARLIFRDNATIDGTGTLTTAGIEVDKGKTLTFKSNIGQNTIIRKVGKGDLKLEGNKNNKKQGSIHLGDGTLEIAEGSSIGKIKIGSGRATIKVTKDNQFDGNQIYFGVQGGTLDLNGHNLEFNDIFHVDKGTRIVNQPLSKTITSHNTTDSNSTTSTSETANTVSTPPTATSTSATNNTPTFTFKPDGDRVFLGSFNGNLNVNYDANHLWELRGNSSIKDLNVKQGTVKLVGDNVLHTQYLTPSQTEYHTVTFNANNINVENGATLVLGRASKTKADIKINGTLKVVATGKVDTSIPKAYEDEPANYQQDTNKIVVEGNITLNNGNKVLIDLENNNIAEIKSKISAKNAISLHKKGDGELLLSGTNSFTNGNFEIEKGIVRITDKENAKKLSYTVKNGSTLEVQGIETDELKGLLEKFNNSFDGILSLDKDITKLDSKLGEFNQLYLGTKGNITLGTENQNLLEHLSFLNLGGDGGTITVQGLKTTGSSNSKKTLNIGNGTYRGKVIIEELTKDSHLDLNVHTGVDLEVKKNSNTDKFLDLGYGSTAKVDLLNNLKTNSKGIVLIDSDDNLSKLTDPTYSNLHDIYIGTSKNKTLNINAEKISGNTYRFSGEGETHLKFNLSNKDLIVDAQGLTGGVVSLDKDNTNYKGKITVQGHKEQNLGSITLKASTGNSLGQGNEIVIKNGGILDVNGKSINIKLSTESNQLGTIFSTEKGSVTLANTDNTEIKNKISGNLDITYNGSGELSLSNTQNHFTGNINLNNGTLKYSIEGVTNQNNKINISNNAKIDITKNVNSEIVANVNNNADASILFTELNTNTNISTKKLTLTSNVTSKGNNNGSNFNRNREINYQNLNLNNHTLITENQFLSINSVSSKGNLILKNSTLKLHGGNHTLLSEKNFENIELNNSTLDLRDYNFKNSEKRQKVVVKGDSTISTGTYGSDGGGASTGFNNPLELTTGSTLNIVQANSRWYVNMQIDSDIKGDGNIIISQAKSGNLKITNNFKEFNGSLKLVYKNNRRPELGYYLNGDNEADRTLNFEILSEQFVNQRPSVTLKNIASKSLILKNVNGYSGTLIADKGDIILDGNNAVSTKAVLQEVDSHKIIFKVDEGQTGNAGGFYYSHSGKANNDGLHKKGKGELVFTSNYMTTNSPKFYVDEGTVTIATSSEFKSTQSQNRSSSEVYLDYNVAQDANLNFKVSGNYTVKNTVSGAGNVSFSQADDSTKYTTDYSKLGHSGDLTINAKVDLNLDSNDQNPITLRHNLKGEQKGYLTIKGDNKTLNINKSLDNYAGSLEISNKTNLDLNLNDATLDNALYGSGTITNKNSSNLNLNNTAHFVGTLYAKTGDISINNQFDASNTDVIKLKSENNHYINITTTDNNSVAKFNFIEGNLRKKGTGTLIINDNVSVDNIKHLDLNEGNLQLNHDINVEELKLGSDTKLILNSNNIDRNITGTGDVELMKTNTLTNDKLQHTGNLIVNADSTLLINTKDTLSYNLTGNHKLTINSNNEKSDTVLKLNNDNIQHFTGGLAINNTTELNNITNLDNQLSGNGIIINKNSSNLNLNNTANFTGTLNAKVGDISINNQFNTNNTGAIQLKSENDHYINITTTDDSAAKFNFIDGNLRKKGTGTLIINDDVTVKNMNHLDLAEGNLQLNHDINVEKLKLGSDTKLILNSNNIDRNITGTGDIELKATNTLTNDKLQHTGNLIVNADSTLLINTKDTLSYNLTGNHKLTINSDKDNNNSLLKLNNDNIQHFTGGLAINNTTELNNITNLDNQLSGNGIIINKNNSNLTLNNTANFTGTLNAKEGDISINNQFNTNNTGTIQLKSENNHYINITTTDNNSVAKFNFIEGNLRKKGTGTLIINDNVSVGNIKHLDLDEGNLQLDHSIKAQNITLGENTKLTLNNTSGNIDHNITGTGNVELKATNTLTNDKLQHTGNLIVNADSTLLINTKDTLSYNLTGNHKLTINSGKDNNNSLLKLNNDNIQHFTGGLAINNTTELNNITNLNNQLSGNGIIINTNSSNLNLNNTADFVGTLNAKEGDISINNQFAANNANGTIKLKSENGHYINFTTTDNNSSAKFDFAGGNFRKKGTGTLVVNNDVTVTNMNHFDLAEGNLQLDRGINAQNIDLSKNTKLILNNTSGNINSNITGEGDVELMKPNTLANNKLKHTGDLIVNADTNLTISGNENLAYHLKGKNTVTFSGENSSVQLHGSHINDFSGTLAINNTAELYDVGNSLTNVTGSGTIVSKSGEFSFDNTRFTGEIVADNANIKVIDAKAKKYTAKNADITLPYHLAKDNPSATFSAINGAFVKADEKQWVLNRENLDKLGKLKIQSGEVIISDLLPSEKEKDKENENNSNSMLTVPAEFIADNAPRPHPRSPRRGRSLLSATTPAAITVNDDTILPANEKEVEIKQGAKLILDTNHQVDKIKNEGTVNLNTHTLSIDDYSSEHGKIIIALNDKTNQVLNIKKTDKNVDVELVATKETLTYLASNGIKIANLPTQLNILNEEQLTKGNYDLTNVNGMIKLLLAPNLMSKILRLTEIHQLNQLHTNEPFIEGVTVKANYSNGKIKEKFLKDYRNTLFKSQANTSGITINLGKTYGRFTGKLTLKALNTDFQSEVNHKTQQDKLKTLAAETGIKVEYKPGYGATLSAGILQSSFKQGKYALLNGNLSLYANPRYPIGKGVLTLENELSVRYTPILSQALPADEMAKLTNPFAYAHRLGLNYQYQKFDFNLATKVTFDNTQLTYIRKEAQVNSDLIKGLSYQLSAGVKYHFTQKLNLSLTSDTTFSKNSSQFGAKIGVTYNF